jgi:hypothetical protein
LPEHYKNALATCLRFPFGVYSWAGRSLQILSIQASPTGRFGLLETPLTRKDTTTFTRALSSRRPSVAGAYHSIAPGYSKPIDFMVATPTPNPSRPFKQQ